jgi:hypothetical protein
MALTRTLHRVLVTALGLVALTGCASLNAYRPQAERLEGRFVSIQNYGTAPVDPAAVDDLLVEVAAILDVTLDPAKPKARVMVTSPDRIATMHRAAAASAPGGSYAVALYFPGGLVMVPHVDRALLGHELAHYVTDRYLPGVARSDWEDVAERVERQLARAKRRVPTVTAAAKAGPDAGPAAPPAGRP